MTRIIFHTPSAWQTKQLPIPGGGSFEFEERWHEVIFDQGQLGPGISCALSGKTNAVEFWNVGPEFLLLAKFAPATSEEISRSGIDLSAQLAAKFTGRFIRLAFIERSGIDWNTDVGEPVEGKAKKIKLEGSNKRHPPVDFARELGLHDGRKYWTGKKSTDLDDPENWEYK